MENIHYGLINYGETSDAAMRCYNFLKNDISDLKTRYMKLGFHFDEFQRCDYYKDFGYDNMNDFVFDNFGLDKSAFSRIICVWRRFAKRNDSVITMFIQEEYEEFNFTQLSEMLPLPDDKLKEINSSMTVKEIRDFKKSLKKSEPDASKQLIEFQKVFGKDLINAIQDFISENYYFPFGCFMRTDNSNLYISTKGCDYRIAFFAPKEK